MSRFTTTAPTRASSERSDRGSDRRAKRAHLGWTLLRSRSDVSEGTTAALGRVSSALGAALLLLGCAGYGPSDLKAGQTEADVRARMGEPTDRSTLPNGGARLDYARGPMGAHTYRIDVDASGRVQSVQQILTEANFETVRPGQPKANVRDLLGRPAEQRTGWRGVGEVWSYRYDHRVECRWFQVWLVEDRVREASYAPDPLCDERRKLSGD
jgi:hypothetical protein